LEFGYNLAYYIKPIILPNNSKGLTLVLEQALSLFHKFIEEVQKIIEADNGKRLAFQEALRLIPALLASTYSGQTGNEYGIDSLMADLPETEHPPVERFVLCDR